MSAISSLSSSFSSLTLKPPNPSSHGTPNAPLSFTLRSSFIPLYKAPISKSSSSSSLSLPSSHSAPLPLIMSSMEAGIGVMGTKLGMISCFEESGTVVPVTVIGFREGNIVTQVKTEATDGYNAVQVGYRRVRDRKLTKPEMGHLEKSGIIPLRHLQEFRLQSVEGFEPNQRLVLDELFKEGDLGTEYILVLKSDNLAQVNEPKIIRHLVQNNIETCMEVMPASSHPEVKEVPSHEGKYESKEKLKFTDTIWVSMNSIERLMQSSLIESSALSEASAISVPKSRYLPVEATSDLPLRIFIVLMKAFLTNPADPLIELGPEFADVTEFHGRFKSMPSIIELDALEVTGDVWLGSDVTLKGKVSIHARPDVKMVIPDGAVLENRVITRPRDVEGPL